jgi:hypothetical protein
LALLSNAIGDYACWKYSRKVFSENMDSIEIDLRDFLITNKNTCSEGQRKSISIPSFGELECSGAVLHPRPSRVRKALLTLISALPVTLACGAAFAVDYTQPTFFSCRATAIITSYTLWLLSSVITRLMLRFATSFSRHVWLFILLKDTVIAIPILVMILVSTCGYFNSCYCSSGAIIRHKQAFVDMNPVKYYPLNNNVIYPAVVAVCFSLQLLIPVLVRGIQLQGFKTMWWAASEDSPSVPETVQQVLTKPAGDVQVHEIEMEDCTGSSTNRCLETSTNP